MSYDIALYEPAFLKRAIAEKLGDWTDADPIPAEKLAIVRTRLIELGYTVEHEDEEHTEFEHPNSGWGLQVEIFRGMIAFSVPYWDDVKQAVAAARRDAKELAQLAGLGYYDGQTGEAIAEIERRE